MTNYRATSRISGITPRTILLGSVAAAALLAMPHLALAQAARPATTSAEAD